MINLVLDKNPIYHAQLIACFKNHIDSIAQYFFSYEGAIVLKEESSRTYSPMDRMVPPNCPYQDHLGYVAVKDGFSIQISSTKTMWNDNEMANHGVNLSIRNPKKEMIAYLSAYDDKHSFETLKLDSKILDNTKLKRLANLLELVLNIPR